MAQHGRLVASRSSVRDPGDVRITFLHSSIIYAPFGLYLWRTFFARLGHLAECLCIEGQYVT
jgi:hypothetical protein